ncbi:Kinesin [Oryctes borbonicus]|uniref:Kinesin-like protein n=1 Tax=Oryctes borbonicus TaxID=1629725 RepID=A0A0T6AUM6_9SCAR|nr:Kinesin [Oryctes borbonicus]
MQANKYQSKALRREKTTLSSSSESEKLQDPVHVFCRLKPLKEEDDSSCIRVISPTVLSLSTPSDNKVMRDDVQYIFKHIFTPCTSQKEIFEHIAYPLLKDLVSGKNGLLFTYGVTGSGKTYTLTGTQNDPGIMPRCIDTLFNTIGPYQAKKFIIKSDKMNGFEVQSDTDAAEARNLEYKTNLRSLKCDKRGGGESKHLYSNDGMTISGISENNLYAVFISYIEIYNNTVYDLLDDTNGKTLQSKILREDAQRNMYINNVVEVEVKSAADAYDLFNIGQKRKRMGHTVLNAVSSRSHSIFSIRLVQVVQQLQNSEGNLVIPECNMLKLSQLNLVDLAGSERCSRTKNTGIRLKEASNINNSLMTLRTCMEILRDNQLNNANRLVPYRDSRLTLLFKNYFEGEGCVHMIVCVNPASEDYEENLHVMKFAEISRNVKVNKGESRYTPYRKKVISKTITQTPSSGKIHVIPPLVFGPQIPSVKLDLENIDACDAVLTRLLKVLKARKENAIAFERELTTREQNFRKQLIEINQENIITKHEIRNMKMILKQEKYRTHNYETKVLDLETANDNLACKADGLQNVIRNLKCTIDEKDLKINQNLLEKERIRQRQVIEKEKLSQEVDEHLRRQREELRAQMQVKDIKLQKVKEILEKEDITLAQIKTENETQTAMGPNVPRTPRTPSHTSHHRNTAAGNSRRRSRSVGDVWLEHNVIVPTELGTVLQPSMKKRKSVTKLSKASDVLNPKQSKYCLISQEPDMDGVVETKLYKADIIQTCGGGAQVVFNDVETLRQESPTGSPKKA